MNTERLYYDCAPSAPVEAEILELRPGAEGRVYALLDRTVFYPEGGGQPADRGTIGGVPLLDAREKDGELLHVVSAEAAEKLAIGPVELALDRARRRDLSTQHTGQHLLSGTILRMTGRPTVSMHIGDETCSIDVGAPAGSGEKPCFSPPEMDEEAVVRIEEAVADAIEENRPIIVHLCPPEDAAAFPLRKVPPQGEEVIRVVEIEGCDFSPCCGTHLASTAEIGMLRVLGAEKYKGMTRVSFIAGRRVLRDSRLLRRNADIVSRALSVPARETGKGVLEFAEKAAQAERRLKALEEEAARAKAEALLRKAALSEKAGGDGASNPAVVVESYAAAGIDEVLAIGRAAQKLSQAVFILASEPDTRFAAFCTARGFDLRPLVKGPFEACGGRGGGGSSFFQGSFSAKEALDAFLLALKSAANRAGT